MRKTIEYKLKTTISDNREILKLLDKGKNVYNLALSECGKRLNKIRSDPEYTELLVSRRTLRKSGQSLSETDRNLGDIVRTRYGFTRTEIEKFVKDHAGYLTYGFNSQFAQNLAGRAVDTVSKVLYGKARGFRYKGRFDNILSSVNSKSTATGLMFDPDKKAITYRISGKRILSMPLVEDYRKDHDYHSWYLDQIIENYKNAAAFDVAYIRIVRRIVKGKDVFYAQFIVDVRPWGMTMEKVYEENKSIFQQNSEIIRKTVEGGRPTNRLRLRHPVPDIEEYPKTSVLMEMILKAGLCKQFSASMDLGPRNIAAVLKNEQYTIAILQPIFSKLVDYGGELRVLRRKLDRQRRANNPDNYNPDGTIRKRKRLRWNVSKAYLDTRGRIRELHRLVRETRKTFLNEFANILCALGCSFKAEEVSFRSWQKNYGKAVGSYAPSLFQKTVFSKAESAGDDTTKIPVRNALSQKCVCGVRRKKKLSERLHECTCGCRAQRDVFSAYLGLFCSPDLGEWEDIVRQYHDGDRQLLGASHRVYPRKAASRQASGFVLCLDKGQRSRCCANEDGQASENHEGHGVVLLDSLKALVGELALRRSTTAA